MNLLLHLAVLVGVLVGGCSEDTAVVGASEDSSECPPEIPFSWSTDHLIDTEPDWCQSRPNLVAYHHSAPDIEDILEYGLFQIWVLDLATGEKRYVSPGWAPNWSPDGRTLCFSGHVDGIAQIWSLNVETRELRRLTDGPNPKIAPQWHPAGEPLIVYYTAHEEGGEPSGVWLLNTETQETGFLADGARPAWSPDGTRIALWPIAIADVADLDDVTVLYREGGVSRMRWSGSGDWIGFDWTFQGNASIRRIDVATAEIDTLVESGARHVTISPDGEHIIYSRSVYESNGEEQRKSTVLFMSRVDGTECRQLTSFYDY